MAWFVLSLLGSPCDDDQIPSAHPLMVPACSTHGVAGHVGPKTRGSSSSDGAAPKWKRAGRRLGCASKKSASVPFDADDSSRSKRDGPKPWRRDDASKKKLACATR